MSQVFVSCAYRDRAVGEQVSGLLHSLGDEPVDDRDDANGTAWWNEVVGRIETCEVFVAVVSPAYADAHSCRLAAKHAAASGLPVVRLDLGEPPTTGLHPVVRTAHRVRFDPEDPTAGAVLDRALDTALDPTVAPDEPPAPRPRQVVAPPPDESPDDSDEGSDEDSDEGWDEGPEPSSEELGEPLAVASEPAPTAYVPPPPPPSLPASAPPAVPQAAPPPAAQPVPQYLPPYVPPAAPVATASASGGDGRFSGYELALAAVMVLMALALVVVEGRAVLHLAGFGDDATSDQGSGVRGVSTDAQGGTDAPSSAAPSGPTENTSGSQGQSQSKLSQQVLALVAAANSEGLPASSCAVGDDHVTCRGAAPNLQAVVLTPYSSQSALYDAYTDAVRAVSGDPAPENVGDCSGQEFEGETSWNLNLGHRTDISVDDEAAGGLDPASEAAGRIYCTESSDVIKLIWTQDPGLLVTATGQPANQTIGWWHGVHVDLACAAGGTGTGCTDQADEQG